MIALRRSAILLFICTAVISLFLNAAWDIWAQSLIHLLTLVIVTSLLAYLAHRQAEISFSYTSADIWFILYLAGISLSYLYSVNQFNTRNELFNHFNYYLLFYFCPLLLAGDTWQDLFIRVLGIATGFIALVILWQVWREGLITGGPLLNANVASGFFVMMLPIIISRLLYMMRQKRFNANYWTEFVLALLILAGLIANRSLGGWISLYFSLLLFLVWSRDIGENTNNPWLAKKYILTGFLLGAIAIGYFVTAKMREPEVFNRLLWWKGAVNMIKDHPLRGVGLGNFGNMYLVYKTGGLNSIYAHNQYLQLWSEIGIFSLLFWLGGIYTVLRTSMVRLPGQEPQKQYMSLALVCSTCGLLFYNLIDYSFSIPAIAIIWWVLLGLLRPNLPVKNHTFKIGTYSRLAFIFVVIILSVVVVKPFLASQRYVSGIAYLRRNEFAKADEIMKSSVALDPLNAQAYGFLSDIAKKEGDLDTATGYLQKAISLNKYFGPFHHNLALLYDARGDLPQAIAEAELALACHRQKALYHYTLSMLYKKAGRTAEAEQEFRQGQKLGPDVQKN